MNTSEDFNHRFEFAAPIDAVYQALATPDGIRGWWAREADVATEVGGVSKIRFGRPGSTDLRIDRLDRPDLVEWTCVDQHNSKFTPADEWVGTTISFALAEVEGGTVLDFTHRGLRPLNCIGICEAGWQHHLGVSLRKLVERGERLSG